MRMGQNDVEARNAAVQRVVEVGALAFGRLRLGRHKQEAGQDDQDQNRRDLDDSASEGPPDRDRG